jgi:SEC-C motif-containing protein
MPCPCGQSESLADCCGPILSGERAPDTALELMRARYSAFATGEIDFIHETHEPGGRGELDREATETWSKKSEWLGFEVVETDRGGADDDEGTVEFIARYRLDGGEHAHHEVASFSKVDGRWYFVDGKLAAADPFVRSSPKVGRNDPCPCGSGKKYKKCCARTGGQEVETG